MDSRDNKELFDQVIKYASAQACDDIAEQYPDTAGSGHVFSDHFNDRMEKFFSEQNKKARKKASKKRLMHVCVGIFVFLLVSCVTIYSVDAFRVPVLNFIMQTEEKANTYYTYSNTADYSKVQNDIKGLYLPQYIPKGFEIEGIDININKNYFARYRNKENSYFYLQDIKDGSSVSLNNENVTIENITVNGEEAVLYLAEKNNNCLLFSYDKHEFLIVTTLGKVEMLKIAESMHLF